jgi:hypothetical protein
MEPIFTLIKSKEWADTLLALVEKRYSYYREELIHQLRDILR